MRQRVCGAVCIAGVCLTGGVYSRGGAADCVCERVCIRHVSGVYSRWCEEHRACHHAVRVATRLGVWCVQQVVYVTLCVHVLYVWCMCKYEVRTLQATCTAKGL